MNNDEPAIFQFYGELKPLLTPGELAPTPGSDGVREVRRSGVVAYPVGREASLKDVIEALGVPHTEVGRIVLSSWGENREADEDVGFDQRLASGQRIEVHPVAPPLDVTRVHRLRPVPLPEVRFVVDVCVGKLATLLRLLGLDAAYDRTWDDATLADMAQSEGRIVLTRDKALLKRATVSHGRLVRAHEPTGQLLEVLGHFGLTGSFKPFVRCLRCNQLLEPVSKAEILHRLEPLTKKYHDEFHRCRACGRIYWPGSHHKAMREWLKSVGLD
ncbi:MAG: Mut7-C ubiquitin/RNAse domain-containing protein [Proteobacteria bacterium]|nr:Mut7-C ubiquitin/RNAse domain-containing protein [Pseudomonadota bacterium]